MSPGRYDVRASCFITPEVLKILEQKKMVTFIGEWKPGTDSTSEYEFNDYDLLSDAISLAIQLRDERLAREHSSSSDDGSNV